MTSNLYLDKILQRITEKARMALDKLRPEVIKSEWLQLMDEIVN